MCAISNEARLTALMALAMKDTAESQLPEFDFVCTFMLICIYGIPRAAVMAKQSINMRLDQEILAEAKKVLGRKETTATVETALRNMINNRKAIDLLQKTSGRSDWKGFPESGDESQ